MKVSKELKYWGYHSNISDEGKKQHLELAAKVRKLEMQNEGYAQLLGSANNDVERLGVYASKLEVVKKAAKEAEQLLDVMSLEGIKHWLGPRLLEMYPEIHIALRESLADLEDGDG